jgi:hypothetical protein
MENSVLSIRFDSSRPSSPKRSQFGPLQELRLSGNNRELNGCRTEKKVAFYDLSSSNESLVSPMFGFGSKRIYQSQVREA